MKAEDLTRRRHRMGDLFRAELGHRWEGLPAWQGVLEAVLEMMEVLPAAEARGVRSGETVLPPSDVVSTSELAAFEVVQLLDMAHPIWIGPEQLNEVPDFERPNGDELLSPDAFEFARGLRLPFPVCFLDFTSADGEPALLPRRWNGIAEDGAVEGLAQTAVYGALVFERRGLSLPRGALFPEDAMLVVPFGSGVRARMDGRTGWRFPRHRERLVPDRAPLGYVQFGALPMGLERFERPLLALGDSRVSGAPPGPRPMLALLHMVPLAGAGTATAVVGTGLITAHSLEALGPEPSIGFHEPGERARQAMEAQACIMVYQAEQALKALYLLESANVMLAQRTVSRQVRRAVERSGGRRRIALTVTIRLAGGRRSSKGVSGGRRDYSHSFERRGNYHHITRGPHARPEKMSPCPQWRDRHPHSELCRREYHPPTVVGAAEGRPFRPKVRRLKDDES
jgi:hypothetical protein